MNQNFLKKIADNSNLALMLLMENSVKENGIYIEQKMTMDFAKFAQK